MHTYSGRSRKTLQVNDSYYQQGIDQKGSIVVRVRVSRSRMCVVVCCSVVYLHRPGRACLDGPEPFAEGEELSQTAQRRARYDGADERDRVVRTRLGPVSQSVV